MIYKKIKKNKHKRYKIKKTKKKYNVKKLQQK